MNMTLLLKSLILSMSLEGGVIPTGDIALFTMPAEQTLIQTDVSGYVDMQCDLEIWKYFHVAGGMTTYQWGMRDKVGFSPFRMDYNFSVCEKYKQIEMGVSHGCYHAIAANINTFTNKIDAEYWRVYFKAEVSGHLFK